MRKILYILPLLFLSCSIFQKSNTDKKKIHKGKSTSTIHTLDAVIGVIGSFQNNLISKEFQTNAFPVINHKVRVSAIIKNFDKSTLKQLKRVEVLDSLQIPTKYVDLKIMDKSTLIDALNASYNKSVFTYLKNVEETFIVTSVSSVFTSETLKKISAAEEVYLKGNKNKDFILELYHNENLMETIHLSKGKVFGYDTSHFCWGVNEKHNIEITDISHDKCSKNSYKTYNKAFKKKEEFKF